MSVSQPVNFRADAEFYKQTKHILKGSNITVSDLLNATLRKVAIGTLDANSFVSSDFSKDDYKIAFEDLKKEILLGHQDILDGKITSLTDVRKEFGLD